MWEWIVGGSLVGIVAVAVGIYLGRRARLRRRQTWQRFARKNAYAFDAENDAIRGEIDGVPFQIRAYVEIDDEGETVSTTEVTFERAVELGDIGDAREPLKLDGARSGWTRPGRARRTKILQREVDAIARQLTGQEQPASPESSEQS